MIDAWSYFTRNTTDTRHSRQKKRKIKQKKSSLAGPEGFAKQWNTIIKITWQASRWWRDFSMIFPPYFCKEKKYQHIIVYNSRISKIYLQISTYQAEFRKVIWGGSGTVDSKRWSQLVLLLTSSNPAIFDYRRRMAVLNGYGIRLGATYPKK